ncbi:MAG: SMC family ATPase, partial [Gemmatimonadota bacterium]
RLALKNFRQHADTELEFRSGLTGIIGPNGSGKTTILEAIAWAIYGSQAVRGTNETLRFNRAPGRAQVRAELDFELRGERYRVVRTARTAELYRLEQGECIASGLGEVTRQLTRRLGMTLREFFNTYFTGQKELQFLAAMGPTERARFLAQVLGYERLRAAQGLVREQRKVLKGQVEELRRALGDPEEIRRALEAGEARLRESSWTLGAAEGRQTEAAARLAELEPNWNELQAGRERDRGLKEDVRVAETRLERVHKEQKERASELERLATAAEQLAALREQVRPLEGLPGEEEELRGLAEAESRRSELEKQLAQQRERVEGLSRKVAEQAAKGQVRDELQERLANQEAECERLEAERDDAMSRWQRDRQDVEARLGMLRGQAEELKRQIEQLKSQGAEGVCPTCKRSLGAEYDRVLDLVRGQYEEIVQDGKWHHKRLDQLESEPDEVTAAKATLAQAREARERAMGDLSAAESALSQAEALRAELEAEEVRARTLAGEIGGLPEGYDPERHAQVRRGLEQLAELQKQTTQLETRLERQPALRSALAQAEEEERQIRAQIAGLEASRTELGFSEEAYRAVGEEYEAARAELNVARLELERARGEVETARQAADAARRAEREYRQISQSIAEREAEFRLHNELDLALGELRDELNDRVRPELSEIASIFLTELTDGRYNRIELGGDHEVVVLDDGEEKPVISGGEEDLTNLVLRLAISQMIADRAGHTLSLLIFDEVFGGLDDQRRESVVRLLQRLQDRFEQVILITHIEPIREGMDQVMRVKYDERTGASVVRDESPGASPLDLEPEDLAALVSD